MSKKETAAKEVAPKTENAAPAPLSASPELMERLSAVRDNMESVDTFRIPRVVNTADGLQLNEDDEPLPELEVTMLHTAKRNVYYAKPYNPAEALPPDCFSNDGKTPDASVKTPMNKTCKGCAMAEFGTNSMKSGKACRNLKLLFVLVGEKSIVPRQITVTPASLKSADQYLLNLTESGVSYRNVRTVVRTEKKNPKQTYVELKFKQARALSPAEIADAQFLRAQWLPIMETQKVDQSEVDSAPKTQEAKSHSTEY